jgi:hypothetical protein
MRRQAATSASGATQLAPGRYRGNRSLKEKIHA